MAFEKSKQPVSKVYSHGYSTGYYLSSEQLNGLGNNYIQTRGFITVTCCEFKPWFTICSRPVWSLDQCESNTGYFILTPIAIQYVLGILS